MSKVKTKKLLKTGEAAKIAGVSPRTVARWLRDGTLEGVKLNGHSWRIRQEALEGFLEGSRVQPE